VRSYLTITKDLVRVMTRVKVIYRSWAIPCTGKQVYAPRQRAEWLGKITEPGVRRRAEFYYQQLDALRAVRQQVRREMLAEGQKHQAWKRLCQIPSMKRGSTRRRCEAQSNFLTGMTDAKNVRWAREQNVMTPWFSNRNSRAVLSLNQRSRTTLALLGPLQGDLELVLRQPIESTALTGHL
jgi:hypothetical protein